METTVSVKFCVGHKDMFCEQRNFCLVCALLAGGGEVNLRKYVACDFYHGTHVMTISLTINLDYLPQICQFPSRVGIINVFLLFLMLQAVLWKRLVS